ncbi:MAG: hypothetical protein IT441_02550 [Phycisphaeraceae bacterium]|nr:hypothetical protein [Phycisphaeraceae bacterium]
MPPRRQMAARPAAKPAPTAPAASKPKKTREVYATAEAAIAALERHRGKPAGVWTYCDAQGEAVGAVLRWDGPNGKDVLPLARSAEGWSVGAMPAPRPLFGLPEILARPGELVAVVEGEKCVDAARSIGLLATTSAGGAQAARKTSWEQLAGREVVILPDHDTPGEKYAAEVAEILRALTPPSVVKIVRLWDHWPDLAEGGDIADVLVLTGGDVEAVRAAVLELIAKAPAEEATPAAPATAPADASDDGRERPPTQAEELVAMALERYSFARTPAGEAFAVLKDGPNLAVMLRGSSDSLRAALSREYRRACGRVPSSSALADAVVALSGEALEGEPEDVRLRVAEHEGGIVLDLGDATGRAVVVKPEGWAVVERSPVLFRRTALTSALPEPIRGGRLANLRELLNVSDEGWPLLKGWLVSAFMPAIPHPLLMLGGQQGTGKSTAARLLMGLSDPSPAPLRSEPRDAESWAVACSGSWGLAIDNVSGISGWWSDALCKAVTGDGLVRRKLFSDSELSVLSFRRVVVLTSIDAGSLRGDLGDRVLLVDLQPIPDTQRRTEADLDARYAAARPEILGALLDLLAATLRELPNVQLENSPRMADFARVLAAVDAADDSDGASLPTYLAQRGRVAEEVVEGDAVAQAVASLVRRCDGAWSGSASDLLAAITPSPAPHGWPKSPRSLAGRLRRIVPALATVGVVLTEGRAPDRQRTRTWRIEEREKESSESSASSRILVGASATAVFGADDSSDDCGRSGSIVRERQGLLVPDEELEGEFADDADEAGQTEKTHSPTLTNDTPNTCEKSDDSDAKSPASSKGVGVTMHTPPQSVGCDDTTNAGVDVDGADDQSRPPSIRWSLPRQRTGELIGKAHRAGDRGRARVIRRKWRDGLAREFLAGTDPVTAELKVGAMILDTFATTTKVG